MQSDKERFIEFLKLAELSYDTFEEGTWETIRVYSTNDISGVFDENGKLVYIY